MGVKSAPLDCGLVDVAIPTTRSGVFGFNWPLLPGGEGCLDLKDG